MNNTILLIEDDEELAQGLGIHLKDLGYEVDFSTDGESGLQKAINQDYILVILDLMLPKLGGFDVCKRVREKKKALPILMLTSKAEELDKVVGLEIGADDYVTKPFSLAELLARIRALLRSVTAISEEVHAIEEVVEVLEFNNLKIDLSRRKVIKGQDVVDLTTREYEVLFFLASKPGRPFTRQQLLSQIWGCDFSGYEYTVDSLIWRLRKKLEEDPADPQYIQTVRGVGYRFTEPKI